MSEIIKILGKELYSVKKVSELLHISEKTIRKYIHESKLRAQKIGRGYWISKENLEKFLDGTFYHK